MLHNIAHMMDYAQSFISMALAPPKTRMASLPDSTATYTMQQLMDWAPNARTYGDQAIFVLFHIVGRTMNTLVPAVLDERGGAPVWDGDLPFARNTTQGQRANRALVKLRKDVSAFLATYNSSKLVRPTRSNYQSPTRLPGTITL